MQTENIADCLVRILTIIFCILVSTTVASQFIDKPYPLTKLSGLSGQNVYSIIQDSSNVIWISTNKGLVKHQAEGYKVFNSQSKQQKLKGSQNIRFMMLSRLNQIVITTDKDIKIFDIATETSVIIDSTRTRSIIEDHHNNLWWVSENKLKRLDYSERVNKTYRSEWYNDQLPLSYYLYSSEKHNSIVAISKDHNFSHRFDLTSKQVISKPSGFDDNVPPPAWTEASNYVTAGTKIYEYEFETDSLVMLLDLDDLDHLDVVMFDHVKALSNGQYLAMTTNGDLLLAGKHGVIKTWKFGEHNIDFQSSRVTSFLIDSEKNIWFSTNNGVYLGRFKEPIFQNIIKPSESNTFFSARKIRRQDDTTVLIGSYSGLYLYNPLSQKLKAVRNSRTNIFEIFIDSKNRIWFGHDTGPIALSNIEALHRQSIVIPEIQKTTSIIEIDSNTILTGGDHLHKIENINNDHFLYYKIHEHIMSNLIVESIVPAGDRGYWLATNDGIFLLSKDLSTLKPWSEVDEEKQHITHLIPLDNGHILATTYGQGLYEYSKKGKILRLWDKSNGLASNYLCSAILNRNQCWISSEQGLTLLDLESNDISNFGEDAGLSQLEYNRNSYARLNDSTILFGGVRGVDRFNPNNFENQEKTRSVIIDQITITNNENTTRHDHVDKFSATDRKLLISYYCPEYQNLENIIYQYRLNEDENWTNLSTANQVEFFGLPYEENVIYLRAKNQSKRWSEPSKGIHIYAPPPFYRRPIFILGLLLAMGGIITLYFMNRQRLMRKEAKWQEQLTRKYQSQVERERKKISSLLHDSVGQQLALLKLNSKTTPQKMAVDQVINELRDISKDLYPYELQKFGFNESIAILCKKLSSRSPISFESDLDAFDKEMTDEELLLLYRIIQESFNNVIKHSQAQYAMVRYHTDLEALEIIDNGRGFENENIDGLGLKSMQSNANAIGAQLLIKNNPKGCSIWVKWK